ncbi:Uncharacterised protein [Vibrio cholerae]|nr:Uncharacterised protein [Vibrio cholerae]
MVLLTSERCCCSRLLRVVLNSIVKTEINNRINTAIIPATSCLYSVIVPTHHS